jgi:hypothetical protein
MWLPPWTQEDAMSLVKTAFVSCVAVLCLLGHTAAARAEVKLLYTYGSSLGQEVNSIIAVSMSKLLPLVPAGYTIVPASSLGFGGSDQGLVVIVNFRGFDPILDGRDRLRQSQVAIDVGILVVEPPAAAQAGLAIPGAFHFYTLAIHTNDALYAASLFLGGMPVDFVPRIAYQRDMDDATGVGNLAVDVPVRRSPFQTLATGLGYAPVLGALDAVFWHQNRRTTAALHFHDTPFQQGTAITSVYTKPGSPLDILLTGGGLGPCPPHPETGYRCVIAPALNIRYDEGTEGKLLLIR